MTYVYMVVDRKTHNVKKICHSKKKAIRIVKAGHGKKEIIPVEIGVY